MVSTGYRRTYCYNNATAHVHTDVCYQEPNYPWWNPYDATGGNDAGAGIETLVKQQRQEKEKTKMHYDRWENGRPRRFWQR